MSSWRGVKLSAGTTLLLPYLTLPYLEQKELNELKQYTTRK